MSAADNSAKIWGRDDWHEATVEDMRERLDEIGPPWGNPRLPKGLAEGYWIAYEALERLEAKP